MCTLSLQRSRPLLNPESGGHFNWSTHQIASFESRQGFLFIGNLDNDDSPNVDALEWFVLRVLPLLEEKIGAQASLDVVGSNISRRARNVANKTVFFHGRVPELTTFLASARVCVAPTRFAAGIPLKVLHAAAGGVPTVMSPLLLSQLGWTNRREALTASVEEPTAFAESCVELYQNETLWTTLQENALSTIRKDYSLQIFREKVQTLLNTMPIHTEGGREASKDNGVVPASLRH